MKILNRIIYLVLMFTMISALRVSAEKSSGEFFYNKENFNTIDLTGKDGFSFDRNGNLQMTLRKNTNEGSALSLGGAGVNGENVKFKIVYQSLVQGKSGIAGMLDVGGFFKIAKIAKNAARLDLGSGNKEYTDAFNVHYSDVNGTTIMYYTLICEMNTKTGEIKYGWWKKGSLDGALAVNETTEPGAKLSGIGIKLTGAGDSLTDVLLSTKPYQGFDSEAVLVIHEISLDSISFEDTYKEKIEAWNEYKALGIESVRKENADIVIAGCNAGITLYNAGYKEISEDEYNNLVILKEEAERLKQEFFYNKENFNTIDLTGKDGFSLDSNENLKMTIRKDTKSGSTLSLGGNGLSGDVIKFKIVYQSKTQGTTGVAGLFDVGGMFKIAKTAKNAARLDLGSGNIDYDDAFSPDYGGIPIFYTMIGEINTETGDIKYGWWKKGSLEAALLINDVSESQSKIEGNSGKKLVTAGTEFTDVTLNTKPYSDFDSEAEIIIHEISLDLLTAEELYPKEIEVYKTALEDGVFDETNLTQKNAGQVIDACENAIFLYEKKYKEITKTQYEDIINLLEEAKKMTLFIESYEFYRSNRNEIVLEINFNNAVTERASEYISGDVTRSDDGKKLIVKIATDRFAENEYDVVVSGKLATLENEDVILGEGVTLSYTTKAFVEMTRENNTYILKNNSKTDVKYNVYAKNTEGKYSVYRGQIDTENSDAITLSDGEEVVAVFDENQLPIVDTVNVITTPDGVTDKDTNYKNPQIDIKNSALKICGNMEANEKYTVVAKKDSSNILYAGEVTANKEGYIETNIPITDEMVNDISTELFITIGNEKFQNVENCNSVYYATKPDRKTVIENIVNSDDSTIEAIMDDAIIKLSLNSNLIEKIDRLKYIKRVVNIKSKLNSENQGEVQRVLNEEAILCAYQEGFKDLIFVDNAFCYGSIANYESIDKNGITLWSLLREYINDDGKKSVVDSLLNKNFTNIEELRQEMAKKIMIAGFNYQKNSGLGYIEKFLTKENAEFCGMDISKYLNMSSKDGINSKIASANIAQLSDIENAITNYKQPTYGSGMSHGGGNSSGGFNGITVAPSQLPDNNSTADSENDKIYNDVSNSHWAIDAIKELSKKGIFQGSDGMFNPDKNITREEFITAICRAMGYKLSEKESVFSDVANDAWYRVYVMTGFDNGIIRGITENEFGVAINITRQDVCTILGRTLLSYNTNNAEFIDSADVAEYAEDYVNYFYNEGIISGYEDGSFKPKKNCTRAEAAKIIYNFLYN